MGGQNCSLKNKYRVKGIVTKGTKKNDFWGTRAKGWGFEHIDLWQLENIKVEVYRAEDVSFWGEELQFKEGAEAVASLLVSDPNPAGKNYYAPFEFLLKRGDYYLIIRKAPGLYATVYKSFTVADGDTDVGPLPMRKEKIEGEFVRSFFSCRPDGSVDSANNRITVKILNAKVAPGGANRNTVLVDGMPPGLFVEDYIADTEENSISLVFGGQRQDELIAGLVLTVTIMEKAVINEFFPGCYSYDTSDRLNGIRLVQEVSPQDVALGKASYAQAFTFLPGEAYPVDDAKESIRKITGVDPKILEILYRESLQEDGSCKYCLFLVNTNVTSTYMQRHSKGITPRGWEWTGLTWDDIPGSGGKNIIVRIGRSDYGHGHGSTNVELHELAHNIDASVFKGISKTKEWNDLREEESTQLFPMDINYMTAYTEEFFAESFMLYYLNEESKRWLRKKGPKTYEAIEVGLQEKLKKFYGKDPKYSHLF